MVVGWVLFGEAVVWRKYLTCVGMPSIVVDACVTSTRIPNLRMVFLSVTAWENLGVMGRSLGVKVLWSPS